MRDGGGVIALISYARRPRWRFLRYCRGVDLTSRMKSRAKFLASRNPHFCAIRLDQHIGLAKQHLRMLDSHAHDFLRGVRPRCWRHFRSSTRRDKPTAPTTCGTPMPWQACWRIKRIACTTSASVDGEYFGRFPNGDPIRRQPERVLRRRFALHHAVEHGGGRIADAGAVQIDARKRRRGDIADRRIFGRGNHGDFFGRGQSQAPAQIEQTTGSRRGDGEDAHRPRQARGANR